jgi:hypothetical protein
MSTFPFDGSPLEHTQFSGASSSSSSAEQASSQTTPALSWFNDHPVIATVLWALGTEVKNYASTRFSRNDSPGEDNRYNAVSWRSYQVGGRLLEAISESTLCRHAVSLVSSNSSSAPSPASVSPVTRNTSGFYSTSRVLYSTNAEEHSGDKDDSNRHPAGGILLHRQCRFRGYATDNPSGNSPTTSPNSQACVSPASTVSPYGFFVAITPPEDHYPRQRG